jgi:hypothetical protein
MNDAVREQVGVIGGYAQALEQATQSDVRRAIALAVKDRAAGLGGAK